jgi:hypothetical protein
LASLITAEQLAKLKGQIGSNPQFKEALLAFISEERRQALEHMSMAPDTEAMLRTQGRARGMQDLLNTLEKW